MDKQKQLHVLQLRVNADIIEATEQFKDDPNIESLNKLAGAAHRKSVLEQMITNTQSAKNNETDDDTNS